MHPYGQGYGAPPVAPQRTSAPKDMGTLSIIFGAIVFAFTLVNLATGGRLGMFTQVDESQKAAFEVYLREIEGASTLISVIMMVMSSSLFVIGFGQRGYKPWARQASVIWGILGLVVVVVNGVIQLTVMMPALDRFIDEISRGAAAGGAIGGAAKIGMLFGLLFYIPYPIIMIKTFRKPEVVRAMDPNAGKVADVF